MGRIYTLTAEGMALDDTVSGDLLLVQAAANKPFRVLSCSITQREQETATQARFRLVRRGATDTTASAGGTVGVSQANVSDFAAGVTATMNRVATGPTLGAEAGILKLFNDSLPVGYDYRPSPEEMQWFCGTADFFAVHMPAVHGVVGQVLTFDVQAIIEEFC